MYSGVVKRAPRLLLLVLVCRRRTAPPAQEAIYVVRHAERADQSADSPLSAEGLGRAERLARRSLRDAGITRIFTSDLQRTIETAAPLAAALRVTPQRSRPPIPDALPRAIAASRTARSRAGGRALEHGAGAARARSASTRRSRIADDDYDNLFIVVPQKEGRPVLLRLKY